jgi:hypothetical protein
MGGTSKPSVLREVAREVVLTLLVCAGALGLVVDVWALWVINAPGSGGADGLGNTLPVFAIIVFLPVQLAAALVVYGASQRRKLAQRRAEPFPFTTVSAPALDGVDDNVFERDRAQRLVRRAEWLLGVPAGAMVLAALLHLIGLDSMVYALKEPLSLFLWFPSWCAGVVAAAIALSRHDRWLPLALVPLYPALQGFS